MGAGATVPRTLPGAKHSKNLDRHMYTPVPGTGPLQHWRHHGLLRQRYDEYGLPVPPMPMAGVRSLPLPPKKKQVKKKQTNK